MRHYFGGQTNCNPFGTLGKQQRKLNRQSNRFIVPAIIAELPNGGIAIKDHLVCKFRQTGLNVTRGSGIVARNRVAPVTLAIDQ
ncbi:hypothetical protein D3C86_1821810 [compost metagenome]